MIDAEEIEKRLGALEELNAKPMERDEIREYFKSDLRSERLISRISYKYRQPKRFWFPLPLPWKCCRI